MNNLDREHDNNAVIGGLSEQLKRAMLNAMGDDFDGSFTPAQVQQLLQDTGYDMPKLMLWLGTFASSYAYTPISNFSVGAVSLGGSGALYYGCNLEFAGEALSFCTHGEQSAITNAKFHGETGVTALAISAAPCGYCRQFLYELRVNGNLAVYLSTGNTTLATLLPTPFGPGELNNTCRLLDAQNHQLSLDSPSQDPAVLAALNAANTCYAPYTLDYAGVALVAPDGSIYTGGCEENCAYNPSVSPLEAALVAYNFSGNLISGFTRAVLVECRPSNCSQVSATRAVLASIAPNIALEFHTATSAVVQSCITSSGEAD